MGGVNWNEAPEGAVCFAEGKFRNAEGNFWTICSWCVGGYTREELHASWDYEPRPDTNGYDPLQGVHPVCTPEATQEDTPYVGDAPDGAVKFEGCKWWNSDGRFWDNVHEEWVKPCEEQAILDKLQENARRIHNPPKTSIQFLDEVKYIQSERAAEYEQEGGERSFAKIATVFNIYTGKDLQPSDVALILEILKNVRFYSQDGYHRDSVVDKISYGSLWAELVTEERE